MAGIKIKDNTYGLINDTIGTGSGRSPITITLSSGHAARLPALSANEWLFLDLINTSGQIERFKVTSISTASHQVTGTGTQLSTTAKSFAPNDRFEVRYHSGVIAEMMDLFCLKAHAVAGGTADAITASYVTNMPALIHGLRFQFVAGAANATTTPTFQPTFDATSLGGASNAMTAKTLVKGNNLALDVGDIPGAGYPVEAVYNSSFDKFVLLNPARGVYVTPRRSVRGLIAVNNAGAATSQLDITWDECIVQDSSGRTVNLGTSGGAITLDINDAQSGAEANKRDQTSTFSASATINVFAIYDGTNKKVIASTASHTTGPTLPSGYTYWAYLTTVVLDGSSQFYNVYARGARVSYRDKKSLGGITATSRTQLTTTAYLPSNALFFGLTGYASHNSGGASHSTQLAWFVVNSATEYTRNLMLAREGAGANTTSSGGYATELPNTGYLAYQWVSTGPNNGTDCYLNYYVVPNGDA